MKDRITLLIRAKNLTAAQFADQIGVQKSSISHIISGRNNASLDFVQKILLCYPEVNMEWLLFGKGPLFKGAETIKNPSIDGRLSTNAQRDLPPVDLFSAANVDMGTDSGKENELSTEPKPAEIIKQEDFNQGVSEKEILEKEVLLPNTSTTEIVSDSPPGKPENMERYRHTNPSTRSIVKIVEFYSDNTFREYFPG
ncbi:MAG: helix-turn-helix transcriptional regulator [Bacteroidota bacterium]